MGHARGFVDHADARGVTSCLVCMMQCQVRTTERSNRSNAFGVRDPAERAARAPPLAPLSLPAPYFPLAVRRGP